MLYVLSGHEQLGLTYRADVGDAYRGDTADFFLPIQLTIG
ncbi:hypothetical protein SynMVIR181_01137 [Synechococcus sp. MVIR-18-1]|nr:hypothetical protein SynMVIR181_01137 [Synechococcus sp. MVIR-18-1]